MRGRAAWSWLPPRGGHTASYRGCAKPVKPENTWRVDQKNGLRTRAPGGRIEGRIRAVYGSRLIVPTTLVPPGPGRFAFALTVGFVVRPTQNAAPSLTGFGTPIANPPAPGAPVALTSWATVPAFTHVPPVPQSLASVQPLPMLVPVAQ